MSRELKVKFSVEGWVEQTIRLADDCPLTDNQLIQALNGGQEHGLILTTVQEGGHLSQLAGGGESRVLGTVTSTLMETDYFDFDTVEEPCSESEAE